MNLSESLQLLRRSDCHLCELAEAVLSKLGYAYQTIDVDSDPALAQRWGDFIPVIFSNGQEVARAPISEASLRQALQHLVTS